MSNPLGTRRAKDRTKLMRPAFDAAAAFAGLSLICLVLGAAPLSAHPQAASRELFGNVARPLVQSTVSQSYKNPVVEFSTIRSADGADAVYRRTGVQAAWGLLLFALSILSAFNLALFRHLRRAYSIPQKCSRAQSRL